jgi:hypothetical protein
VVRIHQCYSSAVINSAMRSRTLFT